MVEHVAAVGLSIVDNGTKVISTRSGKTRWDASARTKGLTAAYPTGPLVYDSAAAYAIMVADLFTYSSAPFASEQPEAILQYIGDEPNSPLAQRFRLYIEHSFLPSVRRVAEVLSAHAAVVDAPPSPWLQERFPTEAWHNLPPTLYRYVWLARRYAWEAILATWRSGDMSAVLPVGYANYPYGADAP